MDDKTLKLIRTIFIAGAGWNLLGAVFGYFNTAFTFEQFFGRALTDPLMHQIYQGAWGTTFVYFFGYLLVAKDPVKHVGIVVVGGIGKVGYAMKLLQLYTAGLAEPVVWIVIVGDFFFCLAFAWYFYKLYQAPRATPHLSRAAVGAAS